MALCHGTDGLIYNQNKFKVIMPMADGTKIGIAGKLSFFNICRKFVPRRKTDMTMRERIAAGNPCKVIREIGEEDQMYYYKDRVIDSADLDEEHKLR